MAQDEKQMAMGIVLNNRLCEGIVLMKISN
jgi:hypothetical protein